MFGQGAQVIRVHVQSSFSMANFFFQYFVCVRKNQQGGGELMNCYRKMVQ